MIIQEFNKYDKKLRIREVKVKIENMQNMINIKGIENMVKIENMQNMVNIKGIEKSKLLHQLWRFSQDQRINFLGLPKDTPNENTFKKFINDRESKGVELYFDHLMGKVIKCDISDDELDPFLYDRANGRGKAQLVVNLIRKEMEKEKK